MSAQQMGKITTTLTIVNRIDQASATRGYIPPEQVRSLTLNNVLVDTGATTLCLPADAIAQLGLELLREVDVMTANGIGKARIFRDASVILMGREGTFECLELPGRGDALLGVVPLEALGIELDLKNQRLKVLPETSADTYLTIL
ncbi:retroviral-like aspartic protease family protein [Lyngbya sp. CCY1209]|jgi:clan AA aspartic protease|uniref:retroviral-like aspartic protease family protein n=1 Tax=Lyngbya sp. CCY1209 TaxID=2886103 RepID=UPI002D21753A|nr:retroviral-like aspartic protease family protein [Lyngbya sp. CCY1209]MEB3884320.1 aspartyl protease family protein [Lyngbya sp. CCY1209]